MEWISVEDKLPELKNFGNYKNSEWVLCSNGEYVFINLYCYTGSGWYDLHSPISEDRITHWMPLPEPPK